MSKNFVDYRSFLMNNVETMLLTASSLRQSAAIESDDLFGSEETTNSDNEIKWVENDNKLSIFEVLLKEKDSLGLFVSGNPLTQYSELQEWVRETAARDDIFLILITKIKKIFTKAGLMMLALEVTLDNGEVEGIIFPKKALDLSPRVAEAELFWIKGKIGKSKKSVTPDKAIPSLPAVILNEEDNENQENLSDSTDNIVTEVVEEVKEYDELPKLIIDNLVPFTDGVLAVLAGEDIKLSVNREKILKAQDWAKLKINPKLFIQDLDSKPNILPKDAKTASLGEGKVLKKIKLTKSMGPAIMLEVKNSLKKHFITDGIEIELWVESVGEFKKVKGEFWLPKQLVEKLQL